MWNSIASFFDNNQVLKIILDGYLFLLIVLLIFRFAFKNRKAISLIIGFIIISIVYYVSTKINLSVSSTIYKYLFMIYPIISVIILAPDIRRELDANVRVESKNEPTVVSNQTTKGAVADAVMFLASRKIGALITIEKHNSLDQYAEKAIQLNSDVSKELLINIFSPLTPLHDGAVIIRGNKIRCAGAYYVLTQHDDLDKTTGSRHRAGIGISEVTDSLTIIVSEETGNISIATEGFMLKITDRQKLLEYIDMFLK